MTSLLFEIGVEEIPSSYFQSAKASVMAKAPLLLAECGFQFDSLNVFTTPRRIVIHAENFGRTSIQAEEKIGPLKEQAYQEGQPTEALRGFLKSVNCSESDVFFKETPRGPRVCVKVVRACKPLRYFFETLPTQIDFPKLMRWEESRYFFTRPIRWTFAFVGHQAQKYQIAGIKSGNFTYGHRFLSPEKIGVRRADLKSFEMLLLRHHVILSAEERIKKVCIFLKESNNSSEELIETVAHLVEEPFPVRGTFEKKYLKLPSAVLTTCMSKNQKIFACYSASSRLKNQFIAIINGPRKDTKRIAKNYESVLKSRLEDAQFFFQEDRKVKLEAKVEKLKEMIFLGSLGTYRDKTTRLEALVRFLGKETDLPAEVIKRATRAAHLAKADLTAHLVYEFPELQGIAGSEYARLDGEGEGVVCAIMGHYFPANLSENYQDLKKRLNLEGALVGLCDRIDLLVGAASLGIEVSGSQDPYALRRASGSIVKILRARPLNFSLSKWICTSCDQFGNLISKSSDEILSQLIPFFKERIIFELQLRAGTKQFEMLHGIFASGFDSIAEVYRKFEDLVPELGNDSFVRACKVMERTANILKGVKEKIDDHVEPSLFQEALERELYQLFHHEEASMRKLVDQKQYSAAVKRYGNVFYQPVHDFFDRVLVNTEDLKIRTNRQALVKKINLLCGARIADLSYVSNS